MLSTASFSAFLEVRSFVLTFAVLVHRAHPFRCGGTIWTTAVPLFPAWSLVGSGSGLRRARYPRPGYSTFFFKELTADITVGCL